MSPQPAQSPDHVILGRAVREIRARFALSQERVGQAAGLHRNYVGAIERGETNPTFKALLKLSTGLTVPLSDVIRLYEERRGEASDAPRAVEQNLYTRSLRVQSLFRVEPTAAPALLPQRYLHVRKRSC
jgi:transcriptional regulator with XRE-family HTH domain